MRRSVVRGVVAGSLVVPLLAAAGAGARSDSAVRPQVFVSVVGASVVEGAAGPTRISFAVTLSRASTRTVTVRYATAEGTASSGSDYVPSAGRLVFRPGDRGTAIAVAVLGDTTFEQDETLVVTLSRPVGAKIRTGTATGTILDDDGPHLELAGPEELVYDSSTQRCALFDVADLPARAVRSADGEVQLYLSGGDNRRLVGPDLDHLRHDCTPALPSHMNDDPAAYDDMEWLAAPYTTDGRTVYSLVHMEHARGFAGAPPNYDVLTLAVSTDGGRTFQHAAPPAQLVASIPDRASYAKRPFGWEGMSGPSNIVRGPDGYYYAFAMVTEVVPPESIGTCLLRTNDLADPHAWRGWDPAVGWNVTFVDPYRQDVTDRQAHICASDPGLMQGTYGGFQAQSLTYNTYLGAYLLVGQAGPDGQPWGFYSTTSTDLRHWTRMRLLAPEPVVEHHGCREDSVQYPSLLDPQSSSPSFETTGETAYLYYTRERYDDSCKLTWERNLVRVPVRALK
jgi:Calx-beta domain